MERLIAIALRCGLAVALGLAAAAPAGAEEPTSLAREILGLLLPLGLVIVAMVAALWLLSRRRGLTNTSGPLKVEQMIHVGPRERVVLLRAGDEAFVVGVTASEITFLTRMRPSSLDAGQSFSRTE